MKPDKWIEQLHDKLADYEVAPPEGLWEEIAPLCPPEGGKVRRSRFVALRWWAVAAAAAVVAVLIAPLSPPEGGMSQTQEEAVTQEIQATQENPPESSPTEALSAVLRRRRSPRLTTQRDSHPVQEKLAMATKTAIDSEETVETETTPAEIIDNTEQQTAEKAPSAITADPSVVSELDRQIAELPAVKTKQPLSVGLYAMNGISDKMSSNGVLMADEMANKYQSVYENSYATAARSSEPIYLTGYEERQYHDRPISYGLTLGYPLTERLSLTTGVVYTKLVSTFVQEMRKTRIWREQTLHYVGIPVNLSYTLGEEKGFKGYVSAGALAYWNVKTRVVTEGVSQEMEKDRMQWSLSGSFGLQYDVIPLLGLYVEPSLSYYPDNKSHIQNFFKDKPVSLSLQVGLRFNLGR